MRPNHTIPDDPRVLAKVSGDHEAWKRSGKKVLQWMKRIPTGWTHAVALEVIQQSTRRAENQRKYRNKGNNAPDNGADNAGHNAEADAVDNKAYSPSKSLSLTDNGALSLSPSQASVTDYGLEPCNSSKGEPVPEEQRAEYAEAVREAFAEKTGRPTYQILGDDYYWLKRWMDAGVRLSVVLQGIRETRGIGHKLAYYNSSVQTEHNRVSLALSGTR